MTTQVFHKVTMIPPASERDPRFVNGGSSITLCRDTDVNDQREWFNALVEAGYEVVREWEVTA